MKGLKTGVMTLVILCAAFFCSCNDRDEIIPEELVNGYWMEKVTAGMLLSFENGLVVYNYKYSFSDSEGVYYAYIDPEWPENCEYLMDTENDRLFIGPDRWFEIIRLTAAEMSLQEIGEESEKLGFVKYNDSEVEVVSAAEFRELFPDKD